MLNVPTPLLVTSVTLLISAVLCLLLEGAGVQEGFKKIGNKPHIALLTFLSIAGVALYSLSAPVSFSNPIFAFDQAAKWAIFFSCLMALFCLILSMLQSRDLRQERGEKYALLLVALLLVIVMCTLKDILYFTICVSLWTLIMMALAAFDNYHQLGSEVAAKIFIKASFLLLSMATAIAFSYLCSGSTQFASIANAINDPLNATLGKIAWSFIWILVLSFFDVAPFFWFHIDYLDGTSSYLSTAFAMGSFIPGSIILLRMIEANQIAGNASPILLNFLGFFAMLSMLIPGFMAIDQRRIARMAVYLFMLQPGLWLTLTLANANLSQATPFMFFMFLVNVAVAIPGVILGLNFLKIPAHLEMTWEDYAGAGRKHPFIITAWLISLSSLVGVPGTLGFYIRMSALKNLFLNQYFLSGIIMILSIIIGTAPVARLAVFLFAKSPHYEFSSLHPTKHTVFLFSCAVVLIATGMLPQLLWQLIAILPNHD